MHTMAENNIKLPFTDGIYAKLQMQITSSTGKSSPFRIPLRPLSFNVLEKNHLMLTLEYEIM